MIKIDKKENCCGCTSCYNICPRDAITMQKDNEGFLYPVVNTEKCVLCGLCEKACPVLNRPEKDDEKTLGYIVRNTDQDIVKESTSGGAFTVFADYVFSKSGVVFGAGYDEDMKVVCKKATNSEELAEMRGSKFVQSDLKRTFSMIKDLLNDEILVMFSGTPCQISGLLSFLGNKPDKLICIDFVCRGVPSPGLWENYVNMMQTKYGSKIVAAKFKNKTYGYHASTMKVEFANGKVWYGSGRVDPMMKAFVTEMASRPSCGKCAFKGIERPSDITMFDCYEFSKVTKKKDDDLGYTSLLVHSQIGKELLEKVSDNLSIIEASVNDLVEANGIMVLNSAKPSKKRDAFYEASAGLPLDVAMKKISPISTKDYCIERGKGILFRLGLIPLLKKIKRGSVVIEK